jgi:hypothetical protein
MSKRASVSARLDREVLEVVERVAERERRPVSSLVRNVLSDWAKRRGARPDDRGAEERAA